jgi:hypothetical protein
MSAPSPTFGFLVVMELDREAARAGLASRRELRTWHVGALEDFG